MYFRSGNWGCQVSFLIRSRADGKRGILLRSTTSRGAVRTTSLAGRFAPTPVPPSATCRTDTYAGGSDAERVGGRRKKCFSLRADEGAAGTAAAGGGGIGTAAAAAEVGIERHSSTTTRPDLSLFPCCAFAKNGDLPPPPPVVTAAAVVGVGAAATYRPGAPYPGGGGGALGSCVLDSEDGVVVVVVVRAPTAGAAAVDLAFRTGNADFIGMRDFGVAAGTSLTSALASALAGWRAVVAADARRLAMPLRVDRAGSRSLSAEKKARCRELRGLVAAGAGGLLWKPSAGCKTGEVELPDKNSGANLG